MSITPLKNEIKTITIIVQTITTNNYSEISKLIESNTTQSFQDPKKKQANKHTLIKHG